jgi:phenylacetate-CoA ligase
MPKQVPFGTPDPAQAQSRTGRPRLGQWRSFAELAAWQDEQLPRVLATATRSPFYRRRLGPDDRAGAADRAGLAELAPTTKQDLREGYPWGMLAVSREQLATYHESSGTSGEPTASYYTAGDWQDMTERYARKWVGIRATDLFFVRTPYAMMITGHLAHAAARACGATVVPGDNRSLAMPYARVARVLHDLGVTLTWSLPTETLLWAAAARAAGLAPDRDFPALRALFVGGEPLSATRRDRITQVWGVPVVQEYGSTETGSLAGECRYGRLHLWADRAIFEVYRPATGHIGRDGRGQLVVTPLFREAMPLLRYNIEDEVEVDYVPCQCGWLLPTVAVLGRSAFGYPVGAARVTQARLEELVFALPGQYQAFFWRAKADPDRLSIQVEVAEPYRAAAASALAGAVRREYGIDADVTALPPGGLVPARMLTAAAEVVKPRALFGPDESWDNAVLYY